MNRKGSPLRVLLVDDHAVVRSGLRRLLESSNATCAEAATGEEAYRRQSDFAPDVTVLDLALPGIGGIETLRRIVARDAAAKVLIYSMHDGIAFAHQALQCGARGYITKASAAEVLIDGIEAVARGQRFLSPDLAQSIAMSAVMNSANPLTQLTARQFDVFRFFAEGCSIEEIAAILNLSAKTVANYQTQIRQRLEVATSVELVHLALKHGVVQVDSAKS